MADAFYYKDWIDEVGSLDDDQASLEAHESDDDVIEDDDFDSTSDGNDSTSEQGFVTRGQLEKRARIKQRSRYSWHLSQDSLPYGMTWKSPESDSFDGSRNEPFNYHYDDFLAFDRYVYIIFEVGYWERHPVSPPISCPQDPASPCALIAHTLNRNSPTHKLSSSTSINARSSKTALPPKELSGLTMALQSVLWLWAKNLVFARAALLSLSPRSSPAQA